MNWWANSELGPWPNGYAKPADRFPGRKLRRVAWGARRRRRWVRRLRFGVSPRLSELRRGTAVRQVEAGASRRHSVGIVIRLGRGRTGTREPARHGGARSQDAGILPP